MKIVDVQALVSRGSAFKNWVFVRVLTDTGIEGIGDASVGNKALTSAACVADMARLLIGEDPRRIQYLWQLLRQTAYSGGTVIDSAISGIEMALWDILGKSLGVPVYQLLGGAVRDRVRVYDSGFSRDDFSPASLPERAAASVRAGFTGLKFTPIAPRGVTLDLDRVQARPYQPVDYPIWHREDGTPTPW